MAIQPWIPLSTQSRYADVDALIVSYLGRKEIDLLASEKSDYRCPAIVAAFQRFIQIERPLPVPPCWIPLVDQGCRPVSGIIVSYLLGSRREVNMLAGQNSPWREYTEVAAANRQFALEDQACRDAGFQEEAVAAFRTACYSLWRVPVVPITPQVVVTVKAMGDLSVLRYKEYKESGLGFALHIERRGAVSEPQSLNGVIDMYRYYEGNGGSWKASGAGELLVRIDKVYRQAAASLRDTQPLQIEGQENFYAFLTRILSGADPLFRLSGSVPQVEQPLPEIPLK